MKIISYQGYQVTGNEERIKRIAEVLDAQGIHYTIGEYQPVRYEAPLETRVSNKMEES